MSRLADDQMIPAIEWFAEQMPGTELFNIA